jgi:hypothetical protein
MDIITLIVAAISAIGAAVSAAATVYIVKLTAKTIEAYNKQVQIGQHQVKATQEQTFNQARPVLIPPADMSGLVKTDQGTPIVQWGQSQLTIEGLQNIGVGPAFNIYGIFFGEPFQNMPPRERYIIWNYGFLPPGPAGNKIMLSQGSNLKSETTIRGHVLYIPDDEEHIGCIARLTLTYHDIFGRKLASIYDYQRLLGWICVGHFEDIEQDLCELEEQEPMTQQSHQFFHRMKKSNP